MRRKDMYIVCLAGRKVNTSFCFVENKNRFETLQPQWPYYTVMRDLDSELVCQQLYTVLRTHPQSNEQIWEELGTQRIIRIHQGGNNDLKMLIGKLQGLHVMI